MPGRRLLVAALASGLVIAGCGGEATAGEEEKARETVETFLESCARADGLAALDILTEPVRKQFLAAPSAVEGCQEVLAFGFAEPLSSEEAKRAFARADVTDVRTGESGFARATVEAESGERTELELESSGDLWLLANPLQPDLR